MGGTVSPENAQPGPAHLHPDLRVYSCNVLLPPALSTWGLVLPLTPWSPGVGGTHPEAAAWRFTNASSPVSSPMCPALLSHCHLVFCQEKV